MTAAGRRRRSTWLAAFAAVAWMVPAPAQTVADIVYATVGPTTLRLDLYLPASPAAPAPLVLWVHGGGWCAGARAPLPDYAAALPAQGVAVASITYRLTSTTPNCANSAGATWPAQIHDLKGAVRFLRANAATWNLDPARFAAWGQSAGAHLAVTLALSAADPGLEGTVGGNLAQPSGVSAVVAYFPPTDLLNLGPDFAVDPPNLPAFVAPADGPGQPHAILIGFGAAGEGLGVLRANAGNPSPPWPQRLATARSASPVTWVSADDPPVFLVHGSADAVVPVNQARRLRDALTAAGVDHVYREVTGLGHVPPANDVSELARQWLRTRLAGDGLFGNGFE
jgi:acetyl esterase/lipase